MLQTTVLSDHGLMSPKGRVPLGTGEARLALLGKENSPLNNLLFVLLPPEQTQEFRASWEE